MSNRENDFVKRCDVLKMSYRSGEYNRLTQRFDLPVIDKYDVMEMSPVDAVEVIRCRECIHNKENWTHEELDATDYTDITCDYWMSDGLTGNDYCSHGRRRSG